MEQVSERRRQSGRDLDPAVKVDQSRSSSELRVEVLGYLRVNLLSLPDPLKHLDGVVAPER